MCVCYNEQSSYTCELTLHAHAEVCVTFYNTVFITVLCFTLQHDSLEEVARAMGNVAVANFFHGVLSNSLVSVFMSDYKRKVCEWSPIIFQSSDEVRIEFLSGPTSPLRFLITNKMITTVSSICI